MYVKKYTISGTTAAGGTLTAYTDKAFNGQVLRIDYTKTDFDDGSTMTITAETSGVAVWAQTGVNASATVYPRAQVHSAAGVGLTYDGTRTVCEPVPIHDERLKLVVSAGGNAKSGTWHVYVA